MMKFAAVFVVSVLINILYLLAMSYPIMSLVNQFVLPIFNSTNDLNFVQTFVILAIIRWILSPGFSAEVKI